MLKIHPQRALRAQFTLASCFLSLLACASPVSTPKGTGTFSVHALGIDLDIPTRYRILKKGNDGMEFVSNAEPEDTDRLVLEGADFGNINIGRRSDANVLLSAGKSPAQVLAICGPITIVRKSITEQSPDSESAVNDAGVIVAYDAEQAMFIADSDPDLWKRVVARGLEKNGWVGAKCEIRSDNRK